MELLRKLNNFRRSGAETHHFIYMRHINYFGSLKSFFISIKKRMANRTIYKRWKDGMIYVSISDTEAVNVKGGAISAEKIDRLEKTCRKLNLFEEVFVQKIFENETSSINLYLKNMRRKNPVFILRVSISDGFMMKHYSDIEFNSYEYAIAAASSFQSHEEFINHIIRNNAIE